MKFQLRRVETRIYEWVGEFETTYAAEAAVNYPPDDRLVSIHLETEAYVIEAGEID